MLGNDRNGLGWFADYIVSFFHGLDERRAKVCGDHDGFEEREGCCKSRLSLCLGMSAPKENLGPSASCWHRVYIALPPL